MSNPSSVASKYAKSSAELDVTPLMEPHAFQGEGMNEIQSRTIGEPKMGKLSARDLLASLSGMRIPTTEIEFIGDGHQAGGTYANVAVATFVKAGGSSDEGRRVAVKMFRFILSVDRTEEKFLRIFVNELRLLDKLSHPNIAKIIGFVEDVEKSIAWLISPWEDNGNLREFLRSGTWEIPERVSLIVDVASGLEYLHSRQPPICHGDLKSLNILVNSSNRAVITDFGSARILRQIQEPNTDPALTDDYPFEELRLDFEVTMRIIEGRLPSLYDHNQLAQIRRLCSLMQSCWKPEPKERPSAAECHRTLDWIPHAIPRTKGGEESKLRSAVLLQKMGTMHYMQNRHKEASIVFEEGLAIARSAGDQGTVAYLMVHLAQNRRVQGKHVEAEASLNQALNIFNMIGSDVGRAAALSLLGDVQLAQSKNAEAEASLTDALAIYEDIENSLGKADALFFLGCVQWSQSKKAEAEASFVQALALFETFGRELGRANALCRIGLVRQARSQYAEAEAAYTQAQSIYESIGNERGGVTAALGLASLRFYQTRSVEAEASTNDATAIPNRIDDSWDIRKSKELSEQILEAGRRSAKP